MSPATFILKQSVETRVLSQTLEEDGVENKVSDESSFLFDMKNS